MLFTKKKEIPESEKEFLKAQIIKEVEHLAISRRTAHHVGLEYEEIDHLIAEEAREQFARFEAKSSKEMSIFLAARIFKNLAEGIKEGAIELHVEEVDE